MIIGHERQKDIFINTAENNRLLNSYIFSGNEGIGKQKFAVGLARSLLCKENVYFGSCSCSSCKLADSGNHPDIRIIDRSAIKIEDIRGFIQEANISPYFGTYKFYILNNAHLLTREAANSFLKTLEEPSESTIFILVTNKVSMLLPTIRSRCAESKFNRLTNSEVKQILLGKGYKEDEIEDILFLSSGSVSAALDLLSDKTVQAAKLEDSSYEDLVWRIWCIKNRDELKNYAFRLYIKLLESYKKTYTIKHLNVLDALQDTLKQLDYNVNVEMLKMNLILKIKEVFSEKT